MARGQRIFIAGGGWRMKLFMKKQPPVWFSRDSYINRRVEDDYPNTGFLYLIHILILIHFIYIYKY